MTSNSGVENKGETGSGSDNVHYDYCGLGHLYNLRVVYEWANREMVRVLPKLHDICDEDTRQRVICQLENIPLPPHVISRLYWEPYLSDPSRHPLPPSAPSRPNLASPEGIVGDDDC